jgi:hypothetical protein
MAKKLIVQLNLFSKGQFIYLVEDDKVKPIRLGSLDNLNDVIINKIQEEEVEELIFDGIKSYASGFAETLLKDISTKYANKNVKIYINDELFGGTF